MIDKRSGRQDIPEMVRDNFLLGGILAALGVFLRLWPKFRLSTSNRLVGWLGLLTLGLGAFSALEGLLIIWSSRVARSKELFSRRGNR